MAANSPIEWTDATFNPWTGCTKVSPGCDHCYAESWSKRAGAKVGKWGPGAPRVRTSESLWAQPLKWNAQDFRECRVCGWRGTSTEWRKRECGHNPADLMPARRRVFCASLADVFDNEVDPRWRWDLFDLIAQTPRLDWLLLTKRIGNVARMAEGDALIRDMLRERVWLGATIVNQEEFDRDVPKLDATPAAIRFLSVEPMLGPIVDSGWLWGTGGRNGIDWVIVGGESGHGARPMHPDWARSLRDQCAAAGVPLLFKQWGEFAPDGTGDRRMLVLADGTSRPMESPEGIGFHAPRDGAAFMYRVGKKAAGRLLDGVTHDGFPEVTP